MDLLCQARFECEGADHNLYSGQYEEPTTNVYVDVKFIIKKGLRLWKGESIHPFHHGLVKQIGLARRER